MVDAQKEMINIFENSTLGFIEKDFEAFCFQMRFEYLDKKLSHLKKFYCSCRVCECCDNRMTIVTEEKYNSYTKQHIFDKEIGVYPIRVDFENKVLHPYNSLLYLEEYKWYMDLLRAHFFKS